MEEKLREILNSLYEAEGLVELALRRDAGHRQAVAELAVRKCYVVADLAAALDMPAAEVSEDAAADEAVVAVQEHEDVEKVFVDEVLPAIETPEIHDETDASIFEEHATEAEPAEDISEPEPEPVSRADFARKSLSKYMTVNDKFRFRRELFGNNDMDFRDALALIETMEDMDEVNEYIFNELQWNPDSVEVQEFAAFVERYLNDNGR